MGKDEVSKLLQWHMGALSFPTQIIVGRELDHEKHKWYEMVTDKVSEETMRKAILYTSKVTDKHERGLLNSVMDVGMNANGDVVEELKGRDDMFDMLRDLFEPEIEAAERETAQRVERETREAQIRIAVKSLHRLHASNDDIMTTLTEDYGLSEEEAQSYLT